MAQSLPPYMLDSGAVANFALIGGFSRIMFIAAHIGFSLLVWRAVSERRPLYYVAAIALHIIVDLLGFVAPVALPGSDWLILIPTLLLVNWALITIAHELRGERGNQRRPPHACSQWCFHANAAVHAQNDAVHHISPSRDGAFYLCWHLSTCRSVPTDKAAHST